MKIEDKIIAEIVAFGVPGGFTLAHWNNVEELVHERVFEDLYDKYSNGSYIDECDLDESCLEGIDVMIYDVVLDIFKESLKKIECFALRENIECVYDGSAATLDFDDGKIVVDFDGFYFKNDKMRRNFEETLAMSIGKCWMTYEEDFVDAVKNVL